MSLKSFIAGDGPYYRITGDAPTASGLALLSGANGVASWGDVGGASIWDYNEGTPVFSSINPSAPPVAAVPTFTREEVADIQPFGVQLPRVSITAGIFSVSGLAGQASWVAWPTPGNRSPFEGLSVAVSAAIVVNGDAVLRVAPALVLGGSGDLRVYLPDATDSVEVKGMSFSFIGTVPI